jgi:hypothetical protein
MCVVVCFFPRTHALSILQRSHLSADRRSHTGRASSKTVSRFVPSAPVALSACLSVNSFSRWMAPGAKMRGTIVCVFVVAALFMLVLRTCTHLRGHLISLLHMHPAHLVLSFATTATTNKKIIGATHALHLSQTATRGRLSRPNGFLSPILGAPRVSRQRAWLSGDVGVRCRGSLVCHSQL